MKKLLIATHNAAKLEEIRKFLSDFPIELVSLNDVGISEDIEETGKTFEENAILKATYYSKKSGIPAIGDDGGLEIDILNGAPGVHSRRWVGGKASSDEELIVYTFKQMGGVPIEKRGAQMRLVLALASGEKVVTTVEGIMRGIIAEKPSTSPIKKGFPFRQIIYIPEIGKYYNQEDLPAQAGMTDEEELKYNHRRQALEKLKKNLRNYY